MSTVLGETNGMATCRCRHVELVANNSASWPELVETTVSYNNCLESAGESSGLFIARVLLRMVENGSGRQNKRQTCLGALRTHANAFQALQMSPSNSLSIRFWFRTRGVWVFPSVESFQQVDGLPGPHSRYNLLVAAIKHAQDRSHSAETFVAATEDNPLDTQLAKGRGAHDARLNSNVNGGRRENAFEVQPTLVAPGQHLVHTTHLGVATGVFGLIHTVPVASDAFPVVNHNTAYRYFA